MWVSTFGIIFEPPWRVFTKLAEPGEVGLLQKNFMLCINRSSHLSDEK